MAEETGIPGATQDGAPVENKEPTTEQQEQDFAKGFGKGIAEYDIGVPTNTDGAGGNGIGSSNIDHSRNAADNGTPQGTGKQAAANPDVKELRKRVRSVEGSLGSILDRLDTIANQVSAAKPAVTEGQDAGKGSTAASLKHVDELEQIIGQNGQFKELEPIKKELEDMRATLARFEESGGGSRQEVQQTQIDIGRIVEETTLNVKYPEWREITAKPEFLKFALAEGPADTEYNEYRKMLSDPKTEAQADRMALGWKEDHPDWWKERGHLFFSESAADSVALIEQFDELQRKKQSYASHRDRQESRLRRAAVPDGISESPATGKTDEESFLTGFKRASSSYGGFRRG